MRRALLIGSQTNGLTGVHEDLRQVREALGLFGFQSRTIQEGDATRDGILAALRHFIATTAPGDAALLYYTGHGGRAVNKRKKSVVLDGSAPAHADEPDSFQYIVPTDHTTAEFRGIFSAELSALLAELTTVTRNVTVVLDCCHATGITLGREERVFIPRGIPSPWTDSLADHVDWLRAQGYDLLARVMDVESNPHAVRLVACAPTETAYESKLGDRSLGGLLTESFVQLLHEVHALPTLPAWDAVNKRLRERVNRFERAQNPDVQGPLGRRLFTVEDTARTDIFAYVEEGGRAFLRGGTLHGIRAGDRFLVMPIDAATPDPALALAELEAYEVHVHVTVVQVAAIAGRRAIAAGDRAFRTHSSRQRHDIHVAVDGPPGAALRAAIAATPRLTLAGPVAPGLATLTSDADGALELRDEHGVLARRVTDFDPDEVRPIVQVLEQLARVRELLDTRSGVGANQLYGAPKIEWGRLGRAGPEPLALAGAHLRIGDRIYIKVRWTGSLPVYISIVGVGVDRSITVLSGSDAQGVRLAKGETYVLGQDKAGQTLGVPLRWHPDVPTDEAQPLEYLVVTTDMPLDMRSLEAALPETGELFTRLGRAPSSPDTTASTGPDATPDTPSVTLPNTTFGPPVVPVRSNIVACKVVLTRLSASLVAPAPSPPETPLMTALPELRVLFITDEPEDPLWPARGHELPVILESISTSNAVVRAEHVVHATPSRVIEALAQYTPDVVHFLGHGAPEGLLLAGEDLSPTLVSEAWWIDVFAACPTVGLVVLIADESAGLARALATNPRTAIRGAVGLSGSLTQDDAREFSALFYHRLARNDGARDAFRVAGQRLDERTAALMSLHLWEDADFRLLDVLAHRTELDGPAEIR
jgi:hypothetical protein